MKELEIAEKAAREAGEIIMDFYRKGGKVYEKASINLLTEADLNAEKQIVETLSSAFPGHSFLCEEEHKADADAQDLWIIDPIDGTNNFAHHFPHFCVSIAYARKGEVQCGLVFNPMTGDIFHSIRDKGAFHNGSSVSVSTASTMSQAIIGTGFYYDRGAIMRGTLATIRDFFDNNIQGIRRTGSAALDICYVGCGWLDGFFEYELCAWDFAAGMLFVEEAGGRISDCEGNPLPFASSSVLAANNRLYDDFRDIIQQHLPA